MTPSEILQHYFEIADMVDLRLLAIKYASEGKYDNLEIVTKEIEKRIDKDNRKKELRTDTFL